MRVDALLLASGLLKDVEIDDATLADAAYRFLASGGAVTLSEWAGLSEEGQAAFRAAGERLRRETAERAVVAFQSSLDELSRRAAMDAAELLADKVVAK